MLRKFCALMTVAIAGTASAKSIASECCVLNKHLLTTVDTTEELLSKEALDKFATFRSKLNSIDTVNVKQAQLQTFTNLASIVKLK